MACKDCSHARTKKGKCWCDVGRWVPRYYTIRSITEDRIPFILEVFKMCRNYSPPEQIDLNFDKDELNRRHIARIIEAVRDGRKVWSYDEPTAIKDAYWGEWE